MAVGYQRDRLLVGGGGGSGGGGASESWDELLSHSFDIEDDTAEALNSFLNIATYYQNGTPQLVFTDGEMALLGYLDAISSDGQYMLRDCIDLIFEAQNANTSVVQSAWDKIKALENMNYMELSTQLDYLADVGTLRQDALIATIDGMQDEFPEIISGKMSLLGAAISDDIYTNAQNSYAGISGQLGQTRNLLGTSIDDLKQVVTDKFVQTFAPINNVLVEFDQEFSSLVSGISEVFNSIETGTMNYWKSESALFLASWNKISPSLDGVKKVINEFDANLGGVIKGSLGINTSEIPVNIALIIDLIRKVSVVLYEELTK